MKTQKTSSRRKDLLEQEQRTADHPNIKTPFQKSQMKQEKENTFDLNKIQFGENQTIDSTEWQMCKIREDEFVRALYSEIVRVEFGNKQRFKLDIDFGIIKQTLDEETENYLNLLRCIIRRRMQLLYPKLLIDDVEPLPKVSIGKSGIKVWLDRKFGEPNNSEEAIAFHGLDKIEEDV